MIANENTRNSLKIIIGELSGITHRSDSVEAFAIIENAIKLERLRDKMMKMLNDSGLTREEKDDK
jgi:hypothetical protein